MPIADRFTHPTRHRYKQRDGVIKDDIEPGDFRRSNHILKEYWLVGEHYSVHEGDDIVGEKFNCRGHDVRAIANGVVTHSALVPNSTWGNHVVIEHTLITGYKIYSRYAHLKARLVKVGDEIQIGQVIGNIGGSEWGMVDHLHHAICVTDLLLREPLNWPSTRMGVLQAEAFIRVHYVDPLFFIDSQIAMLPKEPTPKPEPLPEVKPIPEGIPVTFQDMWVDTSKDGGGRLMLRCQPVSADNIVFKMPERSKVSASDHVDNGYRFVKFQNGSTTLSGYAKDLYLRQTPPRSDPVPVPTPVSSGGWGRHYLGAYTKHEVPTDNYKTAKVVEWLDPLPLLYQKNPQGVYFFRKYYEEGAQVALLDLMRTNMNAALDIWFKDNWGAIHTAPYAIFEGLNEVDAPPQYIEFERLRTLRLASMEVQGWKGIRSSILNLSVGRSSKELWQLALPAIDAVNRQLALSPNYQGDGWRGGYVGEHSYWQSLPSYGCGSLQPDGTLKFHYIDKWGVFQGDIFPDNVVADHCWTGLRILQSKKQLAELGRGQTKLYASELGTDDVGDLNAGRYYLYGVKTSGWRVNAPLWDRGGWPKQYGVNAGDFFKMQLDWWVKMTGMYGHVFTHGTGGAAGWNEDDTIGLL